MMILRRFVSLLLVLALLPWATPASHAEWQADTNDKLQRRAAQAIENMRAEVERSQPYFEDAYAMAVWPGITRVGLGFGGAYGKGIVIEQDKTVGTVSYWQFSSGIQAGAKNFSMILFFKNKEALESLKRGDMQFMGQAGIDVGTFGAHGTPTYNEGVAVIPLTRFGLMGEFAATGVKFNYRPLAP